jgi:hypothetical protein
MKVSKKKREEKNIKIPSLEELQMALNTEAQTCCQIFDKERYVYECHIGNGSYGSVKKATDTKLSLSVAIKMIEKKRVANKVERLQMEISILQSVKHKNILSLLE